MQTQTQIDAVQSVPEMEDFIDIDARAAALGLSPPTGLCFLPRNLADASSVRELLYEGDIASLRVLLRQAGIAESRLEPSGVRVPVLKQKNVELVVPALFVAASMLTESPQVVNIALGVIANYVTDFFKGIGGQKRVRFSIVIKDDSAGCYKRFKYSGDPCGIKDFAKLATRIDNGNSK